METTPYCILDEYDPRDSSKEVNLLSQFAFCVRPKVFIFLLSVTVFVVEQLKGRLQHVLVLLESTNHFFRPLITSEKQNNVLYFTKSLFNLILQTWQLLSYLDTLSSFWSQLLPLPTICNLMSHWLLFC